MFKWIIILFLVAVVVVGGGFVLVSMTPAAREWVNNLAPKEKPTEVRLEKVTTGNLIRTVNAPGAIEPKTKVQISAQVAARITALPFREGMSVKAGDVVVRLDARDVAASLESTQASLRAEEARLKGTEAAAAQAQLDVKRQRDLFASHDVSKSALDEAETTVLRTQSALEATRHAIEIARAQITRAQKDLDNTTITAPFDGRIVKLNAEVGELVLVGTLNNAASVIMEIADLSTIILKARVDEANIAPIKAGQRAKVYINAYRSLDFPGSVERVGLKRLVDRDGTGFFEVEVLVNKPADLVLGYGLTANTDIEVETFSEVRKVPSQAVLDRRVDELPRGIADSALVDRAKSFARVVYTMVDGRAVARPVSTGSSDLTHTIVIAGLDEGEAIITGPFKVLVALKDAQLVIDEETARKQREVERARKDAIAAGKPVPATPAKAEAETPKNTGP